MRSKTYGINVRVAADEKEKLRKNAFYCGPSLSEYLRSLGPGKDVTAATNVKLYKAFRLILQPKKDPGFLEILRRLSTIGALLK